MKKFLPAIIIAVVVIVVIAVIIIVNVINSNRTLIVLVSDSARATELSEDRYEYIFENGKCVKAYNYVTYKDENNAKEFYQYYSSNPDNILGYKDVKIDGSTVSYELTKNTNVVNKTDKETIKEQMEELGYTVTSE